MESEVLFLTLFFVVLLIFKFETELKKQHFNSEMLF